jgi:alpha/beta superfamily hydrolase
MVAVETTQLVFFSSGDLRIEGVLHLPEGDGPFPGIVVCHPHPLYGGAMFNNVVLAICQGAIRASMMALRFNFRGVGKSTGGFSQGIGEQEDVAAALTLLSTTPQVDAQRIGLAGYSFGATVALPVALRDERPRALVLISPPLPPAEWEPLQNYPKPGLILCGTEDEFLSPPPTLPSHVQYELIPGVDHFWWGYETKLAAKVSAFLSTAL